ncbi:MAG: hypothetical protein AABZ06_09210 [Bdellovibrionota bacterium]
MRAKNLKVFYTSLMLVSLLVMSALVSAMAENESLNLPDSQTTSSLQATRSFAMHQNNYPNNYYNDKKPTYVRRMTPFEILYDAFEENTDKQTGNGIYDEITLRSSNKLICKTDYEGVFATIVCN